jgi:hypothetical protein
VFELLFFSFDIIDDVQFILREVLDVLFIFASELVLSSSKLEFCVTELQFMLPTEPKRFGIFYFLLLVKEELERN